MTAPDSLMRPTYDFCILQEGTLPLRPDGSYDPAVEHRCTSVLVWPAHERPGGHNAILTDPCFTEEGFRSAAVALERLEVDIAAIGYLFVTHRHADHMPNFPARAPRQWELLTEQAVEVRFPGLSLVPCPGHMPDLRALRFRTPESDDVWIVGDAVLDGEWLQAWGFYWPNLYDVPEVTETWRSVASILQANTIIPGHGGPIPVTADLVRHLLASFSDAEFSWSYPEVTELLQQRLHTLERRDRA